MSTTPMILIEGATAMPRLRPLRNVPKSFGDDWTLLPPARNWRAEFHALYAAVLHTICLSDRAILSLCQWVPLHQQGVAANPTATLERSTIEAASDGADSHAVAESVVRSTTIEAPVLAASRRGAIRWGAWAGGACVVGGAAMLGWAAFSHQVQPPSAKLKPADGAISGRRSEPAKRSLIEAVVKTRVDEAHTEVRSTTPATRLEVKPVVSAPARASAEAPVFRPVANHTSAARSGIKNKLNDKPFNGRATTSHRIARNVAQRLAPRVATTRPHVLAPAFAHGKSPAPSFAGDYSPFAPSETGVDEYASVNLSVANRLHNIAPGPRVDASSHSLESGGTEWMTRRAQRRVTDAPEQFSN